MGILKYFSLFICIATAVYCQFAVPLNEQDQSALFALIKSLNTVPTGWNSTNVSTACIDPWPKIFCASLNESFVYISVISLQSSYISGTIPSEIGNFTGLRELYLNNNMFYGTLPTELGKLAALTTLILSSNLFDGTIPKELGQLTSLAFLSLVNNQLYGSIPSELGYLSQLKELELYQNQLDGTIPTSVFSLTNLQRLYLSYNGLTGSIPESIGNITPLVYLDLASNKLSGTIPQAIGKLIYLSTCTLNDNLLTGTIPSSFGNCTLLRLLNIGKNKLTGTIPSSIGNMVGLTDLYAMANQLSGTIPTEIGNLNFLQKLYLYSNQLTGTIPSSLQNCKTMSMLYLNGNQLSGEIPDLSTMKVLLELNLQSNSISGVIPDTIGNLTNLRKLYLSNNQLTGISAHIGQLSKLDLLQIRANQLTGTVPESFVNLSALTTLTLSYNSNLRGCFNATLPLLTVCDLTSTLLDCYPSVCIWSAPLVPAEQPAHIVIVEAPVDQTMVIQIAVGISVPVGVMLIAGAIVMAVLLNRRKKMKQNEIAMQDPNRKKLDEVLPARMIIQYSDIKLGREIGAGDFGKVYEGRWQNAQVAIKVNAGGDWSSFYNEADLMLNLRPHPNVVQTLGYCEHGGKLIVVLEFCNGGSLDGVLYDTNKTLLYDEKLEMIYNIANGVLHLHKNHIIHRDLAARNILLSHSTAKVSDFGLSRRVEEINKHSQTKATIGPIRWMAPESLSNPLYNEKTDVWSFGIVCAEILNQEEPHIQEDPLVIAAKIRDEFLTPQLPAECNAQLAQLVHSCWHQDPSKRPDMQTICKSLEHMLSN